MSVAKTLRLDEYRDRRAARLRLARALHRADPRRLAVFDHLVEIVELCSADRAAAVWVDEHGTGLIHPYVVLDHLGVRPRRTFTSEPLRAAWHLGIPSAYDCAAQAGASIPATFAVALGSDGTRAWFLVSDSVVPRSVVSAETRDQIMFLAGECAAVVLNRDLDVPSLDSEMAGGSRFPGWDILADLEGRESSEIEGRRIAQRFVVSRLVRMLVDDEMTSSPERTAEQVRRARAELATDDVGGTEADMWIRTLSALEEERYEDLATTLVELGDVVEAQGHARGAREIYMCAYGVAAASWAPRPAANAARFVGRQLRRQGVWGEARSWLDNALEIAEAAALDDVAAHVLVGLAVTSKETGNLPAARKGFHDALAVAERSGDKDAMAAAHHGLLGIERAAGNLAAGLEHGWIGVAMYQSEPLRLRCLASLAGALLVYGDREAAEDAWSVVASSCQETYYRIFAHDALAHLAALRGDRSVFQEEAGRADALDWRSASGSAKAQLLYYRGLSYWALGDLTVAESWLSEAVDFAGEHGVNQMLFLAEEALGKLRASGRAKPEAETQSAAPRQVREGLRAMRRELVAAGV